MTCRPNLVLRQTRSILIVEDNNEDFEMLQRFVQRSATAISIRRCVDGEQALAFLLSADGNQAREQACRPSLIVLDLSLPGMAGQEVLRRIKHDEKLKIIPVVVFTSSNDPTDIDVCYQYQVNSYVTKASNSEQRQRDMQLLIDYWLAINALPVGMAG